MNRRRIAMPIVMARVSTRGEFTDNKLKNLNVNGGAISLGHALGNSGTRLIIAMMNEMERQGLKRGLVSLCVGGGQGMAMLFER